MQEIYYICKDCGCRVQQSGLQQIKKDRGAYFVYACLEHGNEVDHREADCTWEEDGYICGKIFTQNRKGVVSAYCPEHRRQNSLEKQREKSKQEGESPKYFYDLYDANRWNCAHRLVCLDKYDNDDEYPCLPCKNCKDYMIQHGNHDPLVMRAAS